MIDKTVNINGYKIQEINPCIVLEKDNSKDEIDIFVSHYAAYRILDKGIVTPEILKYIMRTKPKYFIFAHNHQDFGSFELKHIQFLNVSLFHKLFSK